MPTVEKVDEKFCELSSFAREALVIDLHNDWVPDHTGRSRIYFSFSMLALPSPLESLILWAISMLEGKTLLYM